MKHPRFMSREHVDAMNALLAGHLLDECALLDREHVLQYAITGDPDGVATYGFVASPSGVRFTLDEPVERPDLLVRCSFQQMASGSLAGRGGADAPVLDQIVNDPAGAAAAGRLVELARPIGTIEVSWPD